ncbi:MAG: hypothetical protein ACFFD1_03455 [Candidatus Thorarchaeota archaeon]
MSEWQHASWISQLGKWAWIVILVIGIVEILIGIVGIAFWFYNPFVVASYVWYVIGSVILILIDFIIIRPKFSNKCAAMDWDALYEWYLPLGSLKLPWMLIWGVIFEIIGLWGLGGVFILIPAIFLLFFGPKQYNWTKEEKKPKPKPEPKTEPESEA